MTTICQAAAHCDAQNTSKITICHNAVL